MAEVKKTVCASGCDYTTVNAALDWFKSNASLGGADHYVLEIQDNRVYNESIDVSGFSGTGSITSYFKICSNQVGVANFPVISNNTSGHVIQIRETYTQIGPGLDIYLNNTTSSAEGIRVTSSGDYPLITNCVIRGNWNGQSGGANDQDGIFYGSWSTSGAYMDHLVIYGFRRASINFQISSGTASITANVDHCTLYNMSSPGEFHGGGVVYYTSSTGGTISAETFNTLSLDKAFTDIDCFSQEVYKGTHTWSGGYNISQDSSAEDRFGAVNNWGTVTPTDVEPSAGENMWFFDHDNFPMDPEFLAIAGENTYTVTQNGINRTGSEPDPRQDFSTDINGVTRSTPTIGAFEFSTDAGGVTIPASPLIATASMLGAHQISALVAATPKSASGSMLGQHQIVTSVAADPLASVGSMLGAYQIGVGVAADVLTAAGSAAGSTVVDVSVASSPTSAAGSMLGAAITGVSVPVDILSGTGSIVGQGQISVSALAAALSAAGSLAGASQLAVAFQAQPISGAASIQGSPNTGTVVSADVLAGIGSMLAGYQIDVSAITQALAGVGSALGGPQISVSHAASVLTGSGAILGIADTSGGAVIVADVLTGTGSALGGTHIGASPPIGPLLAPASLFGSAAIGPVVSASPLSAAGSMAGSSFIGVDVTATVLGATGSALGSVQITGGNIVVGANPLIGAAALAGSYQVTILHAGAPLVGAGSLLGDFAISASHAAGPMAASGSILGSTRVSVSADAGAMAALGTIDATTVTSVLTAAQGLIGAGSLEGSAWIIGPVRLPTIHTPLLISVTPSRSMFSSTPKRVARPIDEV